MPAIIDVAADVGGYAGRLAAAGVQVVIRYYNHRSSAVLPTKCVTPGEVVSLHHAGLALAVVFQQRGGAGGAIEDFDAAGGALDGARALALARDIGQPEGSAIYFAVDWDFRREADLERITRYFAHVRETLGPAYAIGVYGSGTVGTLLTDRALVDHVWLAGNTAWSGTGAALAAGRWSLFQNDLHLTSGIGGFRYDGNAANPARAGFGEFRRVDRAAA